jgi:membrane-associated protease RseP (regulator of RpoE activity)
MRTLTLLLTAATLLAADSYQSGDDRPMLGVEMSPVPINIQNAQGLPPDTGVLVRHTFPGTAAEQMGIQPGDVITSINGAPVTSMTDLRNIISSYETGAPVDVVVRRNQQDVAMNSTLEEWPAHIPFDRIDADAERRFKDWQQRRQARHRSAIDQVGQELAALKKEAELPPAQPFSSAPALRQAEAFLKLMPAWTFSYQYDTTDIAPAPGLPPANAASASGEPWQAVVVTSNRYRML